MQTGTEEARCKVPNTERTGSRWLTTRFESVKVSFLERKKLPDKETFNN